MLGEGEDLGVKCCHESGTKLWRDFLKRGGICDSAVMLSTVPGDPAP